MSSRFEPGSSHYRSNILAGPCSSMVYWETNLIFFHNWDVFITQTTLLLSVYPCTQSSQCQAGQSTPQGSMGMQLEGNSKCPLNLDELPSGPGPWYIPLDSQTTSASENGHLLSLDGSSFHLHCPTTFIGTTSTTTTFLPLNGKNKFVNHC